MIDNELSYLKVGTGVIEIEIISDYPFVIYKNNSYIPALEVKVINTGIHKILFVSAKSLSEKLENIRIRANTLKGVKVNIMRASKEQFAPYVVEIINDTNKRE
jgi:hypothetical protein